MRRDLHYFPRIVAALNFNISRILGERLAEVMSAADTQTTNDSGSNTVSASPTDSPDEVDPDADSAPQVNPGPDRN